MKEAEPADYPNILRVIEVNPTEESLPNILGLTDERIDIFMKKAEEIWNSEKKLSTAMAKVSKVVENANELAFMFMHIGKMMADSKAKSGYKLSSITEAIKAKNI
jgi:uncharacterized HAD superfamily protein